MPERTPEERARAAAERAARRAAREGARAAADRAPEAVTDAPPTSDGRAAGPAAAPAGASPRAGRPRRTAGALAAPVEADAGTGSGPPPSGDTAEWAPEWDPEPEPVGRRMPTPAATRQRRRRAPRPLEDPGDRPAAPDRPRATAGQPAARRPTGAGGRWRRRFAAVVAIGLLAAAFWFINSTFQPFHGDRAAAACAS